MWMLNLFGFSGAAPVTFANAPFGIDTNNLVTVQANPISELGIATKQYADAASSPTCSITNGGSGSAFSGTLSPAITAYVALAQYRVLWTQASQGNDTIAFNGLTALNVRKNVGGALVDTAPGDIPAGTITDLAFDGTVLQVIGIVGSVPTASITNTAAAWAGTTSPGLNAYVNRAQYIVTWTGAASQGSDTINLNGLGALTVKKNVGGALVNLAAGDIPAGATTELIYDGTYLELVNGPITVPAGGYAAQNLSGTAANTSALTNVTGTLSLTAPSVGGPFRLMASYFCAIANGATGNSIDFEVSDGTNVWAFSSVDVPGSGNGGTSMSEISSVTYANGASVSLNVKALALHSATLGGVSSQASLQSALKGWFVSST